MSIGGSGKFRPGDNAALLSAVVQALERQSVDLHNLLTATSHTLTSMLTLDLLQSGQIPSGEVERETFLEQLEQLLATSSGDMTVSSDIRRLLSVQNTIVERLRTQAENTLVPQIPFDDERDNVSSIVEYDFLNQKPGRLVRTGSLRNKGPADITFKRWIDGTDQYSNGLSISQGDEFVFHGIYALRKLWVSPAAATSFWVTFD